jgi:hypothetical protein
MEFQYAEGMPAVVVDRRDGLMYFNTASDCLDAFTAFYLTFMAATESPSGIRDFSSMAISPEFSQGIYALENRLSSERNKRPYIKVQTTGPCSFALTLTDENKRAIYYNEEFRDVIIKALGMKCRWQIQKFKPFGEQILCFIDEPVLFAFGSSAYVSVKREGVVAHLKEVIEAVHAEGGLAGIHCCGSTEWSMFTDAGVDILSFDAFGFGETIAMYPQAIGNLLEHGGAIAWGVVPASPAIQQQTPEKLVRHFEKVVDNLARKGIDKQLILEQAIITPTCGTGSLRVSDAEKVLQMLRAVSEALRSKHGF